MIYSAVNGIGKAYNGKDLSECICPECGGRGFSYKNRKDNKTVTYKDYMSLKITVDLFLVACDNCGDSIMGHYDILAMDEASARSITHQCNHFIKVIKNVRPDLNEDRLAELLNVTPQYLSMIKSGEKIPIFNIWNTLKMLSEQVAGKRG